MKKRVIVVCCSMALVFAPSESNADMFGGDVVVLTQILAQAIQQLVQLKQIFNEGKDSLDLLRDINRGINDSLNLVRTAYPDVNPGIYRDWDRIEQAINGVQNIYGVVPASPDATIQRDTDQNIAEAITLNNSIYKYTRDIDVIGEQIKQYSHAASPGGAQKLTAESLGVILNVMNQGLRAQATGLKIQAQSLALQNHKEKESTRQTIESAGVLSQSMKAQDVTFQMPRF